MEQTTAVSPYHQMLEQHILHPRQYQAQDSAELVQQLPPQVVVLETPLQRQQQAALVAVQDLERQRLQPQYQQDLAGKK